MQNCTIVTNLIHCKHLKTNRKLHAFSKRIFVVDESMELWTRVGLVGALVGELAEVVEREVDGLLTNGVVAARQRV